MAGKFPDMYVSTRPFLLFLMTGNYLLNYWWVLLHTLYTNKIWNECSCYWNFFLSNKVYFKEHDIKSAHNTNVYLSFRWFSDSTPRSTACCGIESSTLFTSSSFSAETKPTTFTTSVPNALGWFIDKQMMLENILP